MKTREDILFRQILDELMETKMTSCVDGDISYQCGFFSGYGLAQQTVCRLAQGFGVELDDNGKPIVRI